MKTFSLAAAAAVAAIALVAVPAAEAKPYKVADKPGAAGYFNLPQDGAVWIVGYTGEPGQSAHEIAEYAMKRAGDLAAEQHQEWFAVLKTTNRLVALGVADDLQTRAGSFMGTGASATTSAPSAGAPSTNSTNNAGTFGGQAVPNDVLESWQPRRVRQTILIITLGSGDKGSFPGMDKQPEIFPATPPAATSSSAPPAQ